MLRAGFIRGVCRRAWSVPRLIFTVRGWTRFLADCMGLKRQPYQLQTSRGAVCELRPGTSDWWIFLEVFIFEIYQRVRKQIKQSEVIIDIGANVGYFALYANSFNPDVRVYAFEPFPKNSDQLKRNLSLNLKYSIVLEAAAVAGKTGEATLFYTPGDDSGCSLNRQHEHSYPVPVVGINDLFTVCGVTKCDLLKMDCEGSEMEILSAILPAQLAKIKSVIMEYHDPAQLSSLTDIFVRSGFEYEVLEKIHTLYAFRK
jgi:FkbM family methyltransferase